MVWPPQTHQDVQDEVALLRTGSALPFLEGIDLFGYGHSYLTNGKWKFLDRLASRARMSSYTNRGVGGQTSDQMAAKVLQTWTPGTTQALVGFCIAMNDYVTGSAADAAFSVSGIRTAMAVVSAVAKFEDTSAAFVYNGSGWAASTTDTLASASTSHATSTVGNFVDVGFTGDSVQVVVRAQAAACTITTPSQTFDVSGRTAAVPHVLTLSGYGAGTHTVRLTLATGGPLVVDCLLQPSATPPGLLFIEEGALPGISTGAALSTYLTNTAFPAIEAMITAEFPRCIVARFTPGWDPATMTISDNTHLTDSGNAHVADNVMSALRSATWSTGLNQTHTAFAVAPALVAPSVGGATSALVQQNTASYASAARTISPTATLPSVTAGHGLTLTVTGWNPPGNTPQSPTSVTDSAGGTWTRAVTQSSNNVGGTDIWVCQSHPGSAGTLTLTATFPVAVSAAINVSEWSTPLTVNLTSKVDNTASTTVASLGVSATTGNLVIALLGTGSLATPAPAAPATGLTTVSNDTVSNDTAYVIANSTGTTTMSYSAMTAQSWAMVAASFTPQ